MQLEVPVTELQKIKLFVATPMYGGLCYGSFMKSTLDLSRVCAQYGVGIQFSMLFNESLITRARNYMVDEFLRSGADRLVFIDSDIEFNPLDVLALVALDKPIVGGPYPKKCIAWENVYDAARFGLVPSDQRGRLADFAGDIVMNVVPGTEKIQLNEPAEVLEIGTGFMCVKRDVFVDFAEKYGSQYAYNPDHNRAAAFDGKRKIYQYFQAEIVPTEGTQGHERYLSEDYWFCQKARAIGHSVWICPWMNLKHHGAYIYTGSVPAMAQVVAERMKRNEPVPSVAYVGETPSPVDTAIQSQAATPTAPAKSIGATVTMREFKSQWSKGQRSAQFVKWAEQLGTTPELVGTIYQQDRDTIDPTLTLDQYIAQVQATITKG